MGVTGQSAPSGVVVGIYRAHRAQTMLDLVPSGWSCALWALDAVDDDARDVTVGTGRGTKFELANRLIREVAPSPEDWVVVADDDVLVPDGIARLVSVGEAARFGLCQPAHSSASFASHPITAQRRHRRARWTTYVEIGPVFAVAPAWRDRLLPFPEDLGMGWGLELLWMDLQREGLRLGVVDEVTMEHLVPPGLTYDLHPEGRRLQAMLHERGASVLGDLQRTRASWWTWQRKPHWVR